MGEGSLFIYIVNAISFEIVIVADQTIWMFLKGVLFITYYTEFYTSVT